MQKFKRKKNNGIIFGSLGFPDPEKPELEKK